MNTRIWRWFGVLSGLLLVGLLLVGLMIWQRQPHPAEAELSAASSAPDHQAGGAPIQENLLVPLSVDSVSFSPLPTPPPPGVRPPEAPPFCTFAGESTAETAPPESLLDRFVFSEPTVVLTNAIGMDIAGWLPDSQQLLIARSHPDTLEQSIETFDSQTSQLQLYAYQKNSGRPPMWSSDFKSVIYLDWEFVDQKQGIAQWDLWISPGPPENAFKVVEGLTAMSVVGVDPNGVLIRATASSESLPKLPDKTSHFFREVVLPTDPAVLIYPKSAVGTINTYTPLEFSTSRQLNGTLIALYADPYLYLLNDQTDTICEVNLGQVNKLPRWPYVTQWSPNGRYLAMITTASLPGSLVSFNELTLLDTETGKLQQLPIEGYIQEIDWASDSRHILMQVLLDQSMLPPIQRLFLLDTMSGQVSKVLPDFQVGGGTGTNFQMAWSPDGTQIAVKCPVWPTNMAIIEDRICLIAVEMKP